MTRSRFFSIGSEDNGSSSTAVAAAGHAPKNPSSTSVSSSSSSNSSCATVTSRWRRPRLRRNLASEFNHEAGTPNIAPALSEDSLASGYTTEAPSSRGTSTASLATCSPALESIADGIPHLEEFDLDGGWPEEDFPPESSQDSAAAASAAEEHATSARRFAGPMVLRVQDFECGECIGKGSYSRVFLGTHEPTRTEWALKVVSKRKTFETRENLAHLREERYISTKLQGSDFLVRTAGTFQNTRSIVFAMEHLPGGDLYQRLADKGTLSLGEAVAWTAQAVLAVEDLHAKSIVHRDIKPENFLMGKSGTLKLSDFGFARELGPDERLYSQFGTPEYVAPEVLSGCGHGMPVDLWAIGVLIYELLVGQTPFKSASVDEMYDRIAAGDFAFPKPPSPPVCAPRGPPPHAERVATTRKADGAARSCSISNVSSSRDGGGGVLTEKALCRPAAAGVDKENGSRGDGHGGDRAERRHLREQQPAQLEKLGQRKPSRRRAKIEPPPNQQPSQQPYDDPATNTTAAAVAVPASKTSTKARTRAKAKINKPTGAQDPAAQSLVKALLCVCPERRLTIPEVKRHPFFAGVDFEGLRAAVRAQADREEDEAVVAAAIEGGGREVWVRGQPVECISEKVTDFYGGVFDGF